MLGTCLVGSSPGEAAEVSIGIHPYGNTTQQNLHACNKVAASSRALEERAMEELCLRPSRSEGCMACSIISSNSRCTTCCRSWRDACHVPPATAAPQSHDDNDAHSSSHPTRIHCIPYKGCDAAAAKRGGLTYGISNVRQPLSGTVSSRFWYGTWDWNEHKSADDAVPAAIIHATAHATSITCGVVPAVL
jgi:hypothetical protein